MSKLYGTLYFQNTKVKNFKLMLFFILLALASWDSSYAFGENNVVYFEHGLQIGTRSFADKRLSKTPVIIIAPGKDIKEWRTFRTDGIARITMVAIETIKGSGGNVSVVNGGPGCTFITLEFTAQRDHRIEYFVDLYVTCNNY